jgi:hypothetical protein
MKVNQDQFIVAVLGLGLFFYWLFHRDKSRTLQDETSRLNLRTSQPKSHEVITLNPSTQKAITQTQGKMRSLSVIFNYNGHTFEAHEVLGLPAGADLEQIQSAYRKAKLLSNKPDKPSEARDLVDIAYDVLLQEIKKS